MKKILFLFLGVLLSPVIVHSQAIFVNEYGNASSKEGEWVELVTTEVIDIRGFKVRDFSGTALNPTTPLVFTQNSLWSAVPAGTIIVLKGTSVTEAEDFDPSDGLVIISVTNTTYLTGSQFNISGTADAIQILNASDAHVHGISHGTASANLLPSPKNYYSSSSSSNTSIGYEGTTSLASLSEAGRLKSISSPTFGSGNDADNATLIDSFKEAVDNPTAKLDINGTLYKSGDTINFGTEFIGNSKFLILNITNLGKETLTVSGASFTQGDFTNSSPFSQTEIGSKESGFIEIQYTPTEEGTRTATFTFTSNDPTATLITLNLTGLSLIKGKLTSIAEIRTLPLGTVVAVGGRVTVGNELGGPAYFQDATGALSVYLPELFESVVMGDSIHVTGPLAEFGTTAAGKGLLQISGEGITYSIIPTENVIPKALSIKVSELKEINQSQLIKIKNVVFSTTGNFAQNTNYTVNDGTGNIDVRIDNNTNIINAEIPTKAVDVVGVLSRYGGVLQLLPRSVDDLGIASIEVPGVDVPLSETFDIVTWNIEWFGSPANGPTNETLQLNNAAKVIQTMDADLYALQEISDNTAFNSLVAKLVGYRGFVAPISQTQKTAFIFKTATVDSISARFLSTTWSSNNAWGNGRYPFEFVCSFTLDNLKKEFSISNIHAKAIGDKESYERRVADSNELKAFYDSNLPNANIILLGDYNDFTIGSTYSMSVDSPYKNFVDDSLNYKIVTQELEKKGFGSYSNRSMIDHITISNELYSSHFDGTTELENPTYIGNYLSTTADHFPVKTRFRWAKPTSVENETIRPLAFSLAQNYPNPFNPSTTIAFALPKSEQISIQVYSVIGSKVADILSNTVMGAGEHQVQFDASKLASGTYIYQLRTASGLQITKMMTLIK